MAIKRGHRFPVEHGDVFPKGLMLLGPIGPHMEYERPNVQNTDPQTGLAAVGRGGVGPGRGQGEKGVVRGDLHGAGPAGSVDAGVGGGQRDTDDRAGRSDSGGPADGPGRVHVRRLRVPRDGDQGRHEFAVRSLAKSAGLLRGESAKVSA